MAEEVAGVLRGVDGGDFDLRRRHALLHQLRGVGLPQVEVGVGVRAVGEAEEAIRAGQFGLGHLENFVAHFVTGRANAGTDSRHHIRRFCAVGGLHRPQGRRSRAVDGSPPAGVTDPQRVAFAVIEENGGAVGKDEEEG